MKKILIFGASGMLGNTLMRFFSKNSGVEIFGTIRFADSKEFFPIGIKDNLIDGVRIDDFERLQSILLEINPDVVINCIGLVKQASDANDPLQAIFINSYWPHCLAKICSVAGARLIQVSTDCIFSGDRGNYLEDDFPDATDLYGRTKFLGELKYPNSVTLRTSIIGHELRTKRSLVDWFLSQKNGVNGYTNAIFSGLPTVELATVIQDYVIPNPGLSGLFHVSAEPISKFNLLQMIAHEYGKDITITPDDTIKINRSLDAKKFKLATGYSSKSWTQLIAEMHSFG
jgi:dTDP-4-dehydrorhamnose reductase